MLLLRQSVYAFERASERASIPGSIPQMPTTIGAGSRLKLGGRDVFQVSHVGSRNAAAGVRSEMGVERRKSHRGGNVSATRAKTSMLSKATFTGSGGLGHTCRYIF